MELRHMSVFDQFDVSPIINAKGPATRLSGGIMRPEVSRAMVEASRCCVDMAELQAAASKAIAAATGAEAGYVASGAAACLLLATAACVTGLDPGAMARLPDTTGMKNEVVMVRSQRNFYDHAVRAAGVKIIEVGLPDRYAGAGVRDAEAWEIDDAITERTAAIFYVAGAQAQPPLKDVSRIGRARGVPVIVDAAAQLPPQSNLKRFITEGADLVAYSGGKALGGPQASGILCGRRDLIMAAALQHLDHDIHWDMWEPPAALIDKSRLKGTPQHGIGRTCKVGKEEIAGLLTALRLFIAEGDAARHARWLKSIHRIASRLGSSPAVAIRIRNEGLVECVPQLELTLQGDQSAAAVIDKLRHGKPSIHVDPAERNKNRIIINPTCLLEADVELVAERLAAVL
jgi:D-glucosaminate-6-phosphate ammonia-lyase